MGIGMALEGGGRRDDDAEDEDGLLLLRRSKALKSGNSNDRLR